MSLVAIASAKGSPGVTTTTLALGALWPRQVLVVECDTSGADIPLRMAGESGGVLDPDRGLLSLAAAGRKGLHPNLVLSHTQRMQGGTEVLVGARVPEQTAGMSGLWPVLGPALDSIEGYDVLADCGRVASGSVQLPVLRAARLLVLVCTADPGSVIHLRERVNVLAPTLEPHLPTGTPIAVAVIAPAKHREAVEQVREVLARTEVPLQAVWHIADDRKGAGFFNGAVLGRADKTMLVKSLRPVTAQAAEVVAPFFESLEPPVDTVEEDAAVPAETAEAPPQEAPEEQAKHEAGQRVAEQEVAGQEVAE